MPSILTIPALATIRRRAGLTRTHIATMTAHAGCGISVDRLKELENGPYRAEPWYDEARTLARIFLLDGVLPLMRGDDNPSGNLTTFDLGPSVAGDTDLLVAGVRLPLSVACRIALAHGLDDPMQLDQVAIHQQVWSTLEANERGARPGECPWCLADIGRGQSHRDTCLPANLWRPRASIPYITAGLPTPRQPRTKGSAKLAHNMQKLRKAARMTQAQLAAAVSIHPNYIARMEQCNVPVTDANAENIARVLGCTPAQLFGGSSAARAPSVD